MVAAENGHTDTVKILLRYRSRRFATDTGGHTAADLAESAGHTDIASLISRNPLPDELALESQAEVAKSMDKFVDEEASKSPDSAVYQKDSMPSGKFPPSHSSGQTMRPNHPNRSRTKCSVRRSLPQQARANPAKPAPSATVGNGSFAAPPLIMRHYREREVPIDVGDRG